MRNSNIYLIKFIYSFIEGKAYLNSLSTANVDHFYRVFQLSDGTLVNCQIYDTAGQERYHSIVESYYRKANAVLLVYDISEKQSFEKIKKYYIKQIKDKCKKDIPIILLGNKTDKENERKISKEEGMALAKQEDYEFEECSCSKNINVASAFETLLERWNFERHQIKEKEKEKEKRKESPLRKSTKTDKRTKSFMDLNSEKKMVRCNTQRSRFNSSINIEIREKSGTISLKKGGNKKNEKKCC